MFKLYTRPTLLGVVSLFTVIFCTLSVEARKAAETEMDEKPKQEQPSRKRDSTPLHAHTEPVFLVFGALNATLDIPIGDDTWSLGPSIWNFGISGGLVSLQATGVGLRVNKHFMGKAWEDSWYLGGGPQIVYLRADFLGYKAGAYGITGEISGGYQWAWDRVSLRLGAGYGPTTPIVDFAFGIFF